MMGLGKINFWGGLDLVSQLMKVEEQKKSVKKTVKIGAKLHPEWMHLRTLLRAACSC